ncbi:branched-chain amino acid ABC transporter permease [Verminephrobacter eiseniae]|uniref:branched-chain amino acid ABC transporter permease n=1 Tax=Verminephrobacter eiseniae TaxID=364317 RepID=UPI0022373C42|nr:branched-chain amino acid ABC transporter permease [Verminephrobacter eiseniae]MCW5261303.1 branched-chain amino acid ABC transporter permease [Verminephrobacter eiseniae]
MRKPLAIAIGALALSALLLPAFAADGYVLSVGVTIFIYAMLAVSLDLVLGWAGQFSFAHAAFFGIGAYTAAIAQRDFGAGFWSGLPAGIAVAAACGLLLGLPALRLRGHFLSIVTIAFQTIVYLGLTQWTSLTGGQNGISIQPIAGFETMARFYCLALVVSLAAVLASWLLTHSRLGQTWQALRDDETLARAIGLDTTAAKLGAFVIAAAIAGAAGVLAAFHIRGVTPNDYTIMTSALIVSMLVVGGRGTLWGPLLGAVVLTVLPEWLSFAANYRLIIFGLLMIVMVIALPQGVVGAWMSRKRR